MSLILPESPKGLFTPETVNGFHLWQIILNGPLPSVIESIPLPEAELQRAANLLRESDRILFLKRRRLLRYLLGTSLDLPPETIAFKTGGNGKPELDLPQRSKFNLFFNISHSESMFLMAMGPTPVGVDIEKINVAIDIAAIRQCFLSSRESQWLENYATSRTDFFKLWTMKEALLKAKGLGIAALRQEEVCPDEAGSYYQTAWEVHALKPQTGFAAAIAFRSL